MTLDELANGAPLVITREVVLPVDFVLGARTATDLDAGAHDRRPPAGRPAVPGLAARRTLPDATVVEVLSNGAAAVGAAERRVRRGDLRADRRRAATG